MEDVAGDGGGVLIREQIVFRWRLRRLAKGGRAAVAHAGLGPALSEAGRASLMKSQAMVGSRFFGLRPRGEDELE
jgi:hypothetical protein